MLPAAGNVVAEMVGQKTMNPKESRSPHWRRRILEKQKALRKDLGQLNRMKRNELQNEGTKSKLERKYRIEEKGIVVSMKKYSRGFLQLEQSLKDMTIGQSSTDRIACLNQTKRNCSMN